MSIHFRFSFRLTNRIVKSQVLISQAMAKSNCAADNDICKEIIRCVNFAAIKHKDQRRKDEDKTPYVNHVIGVAHILTHEANITDIGVIQAALLHDTVEDTDTSFQEIKDEFGDDVLDLVKDVTDDKSLPKAERKRQQILHAPHTSQRAKLIKLADKLYNLRDLSKSNPEGWGKERVDEYFHWSVQVVVGLRGANKILEDKLDEVFCSRGIDIDTVQET